MKSRTSEDRDRVNALERAKLGCFRAFSVVEAPQEQWNINWLHRSADKLLKFSLPGFNLVRRII
jgi:hypothetical protein